MKLMPALILNVVTVVAALAIYDGLRSERAAPVPDANPVPADIGPLERRVAALEADRVVVLRGERPDLRILERLDALERRMVALRAIRDESPDPVAVPEGAPSPEIPLPRPEGEPSAKAIETFRKLQAASRRQDRLKRDQARISAALTKAGVRLTDAQQSRLVEAHVAFQGRYTEIWTEAKTRGAADGDAADWPTIIAEANLAIQQEFTAQISEFIHAADAALIAAALHPPRK